MKNKKGGLIAIIAVFVVLMVLGSILRITDEDKKVTDYADLSSAAQVFAEKILVKQLKHPDGWEYEYNKVIREDSAKYSFQAVILAQNSFGVRSRLSYLLQLQYVGTKDHSRSLKEYSKASNWKILRNDLSE
ncbi:hypothetical protein [Dysgonomonas sp. HGC4]|uniref:hypothetical protein n=1 Tax=Dysgonomonas sp. HGC4 TaxID=1658009 RepID=UPI00068255C4|nr:hypothetical protein [Dysgonomonas sp. HGC4]MBD8348551.1 hypothetical protein [Dysgonomonas sp. HGC4]